MQLSESENALLDKRLDDICEGLTKAIDREVSRRQREGLPIWVEKNGNVVDLQKKPPPPRRLES